MSADQWRVRHPGIGVLGYGSEEEARVAAGTAGEILPPEPATAERSGLEEAVVAGTARILDESPWRAGRKVGRTLYRQAGPEPSLTDALIGVMDTPALAAQVVAEHRHAVGYRAMFGGVEQRAAERNPDAPCDNDALAACLGYVPQSRLVEVEAERDRLRERYVTEHEAHTSTMFERDQLREAVERVRALHSPKPGWEREWKDPAEALRGGWPHCAGCELKGVGYREISRCPTLAALGAADIPLPPPNTDPKVGDDAAI